MPNTGTLIKFKHGTQTSYGNVVSKDPNTIYFCSDSQRLFVGDVEYTRPIQHGSSVPESYSPPNSLFVVESDSKRELYFSKDGKSWDKIAILPATISGGVFGNNATSALTFGSKFYIPRLTIDNQGFVTAASNTEMSLPAAPAETSVSIVKNGNGNAVTEITAAGHALTVKSGTTFATKSELDTVSSTASAASSQASTNKAAIDTLKSQISGLTGAMHFAGVSTTDPKGSGATVNGHTSWVIGDVVLYGNKEYVLKVAENIAANWVELGDEGSFLTKTEATNTYQTKAQASTDLQTAKSYADSKVSALSFAPTSHAHGNITNDGKCGSVTGQVLVTGESGAIKAAAAIAADNVPNLDASKISTGTFNADRIPSLTMSKISDAGTAAKSAVSTSGPSNNSTNLVTEAQVKLYVDNKMATAIVWEDI